MQDNEAKDRCPVGKPSGPAGPVSAYQVHRCLFPA
jgi:hypothetical protein